MKLITINTHSIVEPYYETKLHTFVETILREKPDIIAMQEVNQTANAKPVLKNGEGLIPIKTDNHALKAVQLLKEGGLNYNLVWLGIKSGYSIYDEGIALLSIESIMSTKSCLLSKRDDYNNWKTRKALFAKVDNVWYGCLHTGMWNDAEEPFSMQWDRLQNNLPNGSSDNIFLMGDFNCPSHKKGEGYDKIISSGWFDTYTLAKIKDEGFTTCGKIDGWRTSRRQRIDYIFTNHKIKVEKSETLFGQNPVSDHLGVMITL